MKNLSIWYKFWKVRRRLSKNPFAEAQDTENFYVALNDIQAMNRLRDNVGLSYQYCHVNGIDYGAWKLLLKPLSTDKIEPVVELSKRQKLELLYDFVKKYHLEITSGKKVLYTERQPVEFYASLANALIGVSRKLGDFSNLSHHNWLHRGGVATFTGED